ncbi:MAG: ABC transporter ATP-binding protein/permease [Oscillospiraceae bacterium]|nr:ABC transporter ATP-binding protein/permease [Oscillospiraceae bacterium]
MLKLKLENIRKTYKAAETVTALNGVSMAFRDSEFVSILGPSGCGKTTLLNLVGGLDRYDSGDLIIGGKSTKQFKNADWDAYRNCSVGFVFQSYNLIGHQTVLQNVEIALTLSGVSARARRKRAKQALIDVGLGDQFRKKPNQLSGGQMQRVAIARALINNPDIILADEPTGALDSQTSTQVMEILKEIAKTRLVIMVTHNAELADEYSTRIIRLLDGEVQSDSNPVVDDEVATAAQPAKFKKTSMSFVMATALSFKNLMTKRGRTLITAFAGSIGIIGIALVLALSAGMGNYIDTMQSEALANFPLVISENPMDMEAMMQGFENGQEAFTEDNIVYRWDRMENMRTHTNVLTQEYFDYVAALSELHPDAVHAQSWLRLVNMNLLARGEDTTIIFDRSHIPMGMTSMSISAFWQEMPDNPDFVLSLYELIGEDSRMPTEPHEILLVVDEYNRIDHRFFTRLGFFTDSDSLELTDFIGATPLSLVFNDDWYEELDSGFFATPQAGEFDRLFDEGLQLEVVGVLRMREGVNMPLEMIHPGLLYLPSLTQLVLDNAGRIAEAQADSDYVLVNVDIGGPGSEVQAGTPLYLDATEELRTPLLQFLGYNADPIFMLIYPRNYEGKDVILEYLDAWNEGRAEEEQILYDDPGAMIAGMITAILGVISAVLIAFTAISLFVSTIMIAIIIYVSVLERTKEIGILRAVGARKKDISRVFNAEAALIGLGAGLLGVGIAFLLTIPINAVVYSMVEVPSIASLPVVSATVLVLGSIGLTLLAGFIPSKMAAKKDPVVALRTE